MVIQSDARVRCEGGAAGLEVWGGIRCRKNVCKLGRSERKKESRGKQASMIKKQCRWWLVYTDRCILRDNADDAMRVAG